MSNCAPAFERETELFFENIVTEDRSVLEFIDADYTFLNERLAKYYGIPGVKGSYFRRVALKGLNGKAPERGGILTQASVLMVTSYPTRTSPVLRGKWILESILNAPPPPPPPNVPTLDETASTTAKSLRETFEKHRANVACASCHSRLDPLGFALENFDAVGKYRSKEGESPIDATGNLPDGTVIDGVPGLKKIILGAKDGSSWRQFGGQASDLCAGPRPGVLRSARGARYPKTSREERLQVFVLGGGDCE